MIRMGEAFLCTTCGTQYPPSHHPPEACPICQDERQYIGCGGQQWITPEALRAAQPEMQRAAGKGVIHDNTVARKLSRLSSRIKALAAG